MKFNKILTNSHLWLSFDWNFFLASNEPATWARQPPSRRRCLPNNIFPSFSWNSIRKFWFFGIFLCTNRSHRVGWCCREEELKKWTWRFKMDRELVSELPEGILAFASIIWRAQSFWPRSWRWKTSPTKKERLKEEIKKEFKM